MAINPPSDIILDVVNAADPTSLKAAQDKLLAGHAARTADALSVTDRGFDATLERSLDTRRAGLDRIELRSKEKDKVPETYRKFEAVVLENFVKSMLPKENEAVFGKGVSGEMWRGMMAEQLGDALAKGGGIGIAEQLARQEHRRVRDKDGRVTFDIDDRRTDVTQQVTWKHEMQALDKLLPGDHSGKADDETIA